MAESVTMAFDVLPEHLAMQPHRSAHVPLPVLTEDAVSSFLRHARWLQFSMAGALAKEGKTALRGRVVFEVETDAQA